MNPLIEMVCYAAVGTALLVVNKLVLGSDPNISTIALLILGASAGFARGSYAPPVIGKSG